MEEPIVLLIEDSDDHAFFFTHTAKHLKHGLRVERARDGQEAIDYLLGAGKFSDRGHFPMPNVLLVDLKMPVCDGYDFLAWKRGQPALACIPAIIHTSSTLPEDVRRCYELGAHSFTTKLGSLEAMRRRVETLRAWWFEHCVICPPSPA